MYLDRRLFALTQGVRLRILLAAGIGLLASAAGVGRLALSGLIIANVFLGASPADVAWPLLGVAGLIGLRAVLQYLRDGVAQQTAMEVKIRLRENLYRHALRLGPGFFNQRRTG